MKFIKAQEAEFDDQVIIMGHPYEVRTVKEVTHDDPLPVPPWEDDGGRVRVPRYTLWFTDGSSSDEVGSPQFLLVKRDRPTEKTSKEKNDELRVRLKNVHAYLNIDDEMDCSTLMLESIAKACHDLREALDERFCLSTACDIKPR